MVALENPSWFPFLSEGDFTQSEKPPLFEKAAGGDFRHESWTLNYKERI
jgi:hypothetical protein